MYRCQEFGLTRDEEGIEVEPYIVRERLQKLMICSGGWDEFGFQKGCLGMDPWEILHALEFRIVYMGRYGRQSADSVEEWPLDLLHERMELVGEFVKAENPKVTEKTETEWT